MTANYSILRARSLSLLLLLFLLLPSCSQPDSEVYPSSRPLTRWWWFASEIQKADVEDQLNWLKNNGFGGVEVAWVYPLNRMQGDTVNYTPRQKWLSPEWTEVVTHAKRYADSIGLTMDFTFGSLWPFGDLEVTPEESSKQFGDTAFRQWIRGLWDYPAKGLVIDHLNRQAFERYATRMNRALEPAMRTGQPSGLFVDSWEVQTRNIWTNGFDSLFLERFGYDITPWMEAGILTDTCAGARYDYMKLVSELVINNFFIPFSENARANGGFSRAQCMGSPTDILKAYSMIDVPESEAMLYEPYYTRIVASAAALSGKKIITAETFTCLYGWPRTHHRQEKASDLKIVADALFAHGLNQIVWHGTPYNPVGSDSISFYATVHAGPGGSLTAEIPHLNSYLTSTSEQLRRGQVYSDVAIYLPIEDAWIDGEMPKEKQLPWAWGEYELRYLDIPEELRGYQPLWINNQFLANGKLVDTNRGLKFEVGDCSFSILYIDSKFLDISTLKTITQLAESGFPVFIKQTPQEAGLVTHPEFIELTQRLMALSPDEWPTADLAPPLLEGNNLPYFWARQDGSKYLLFFAHPVAREFRYPVKYGQSETTGTLSRNIKINLPNRSIEYELVFQPGESLLIEVSRNGKVRRIGA
ncbi:MAG: glycosyl hydrolase [Bacteroidales bacterium]|nr:glycosyl hydrolase [Bacteroidales bacterium]